jgi:hypothetical protein
VATDSESIMQLYWDESVPNVSCRVRGKIELGLWHDFGILECLHRLICLYPLARLASCLYIFVISACQYKALERLRSMRNTTENSSIVSHKVFHAVKVRFIVIFFDIEPIARLKDVDVQKCSRRSSAIREVQIAHTE